MNNENQFYNDLEQIAEFMTKLPLPLPLEESLTAEQALEWGQRETHWHIGSICFEEFGLGHDNPLLNSRTKEIIPSVEIEPLDKWHCDYFWELAEQYWRLWELTQLVSPHVKAHLEKHPTETLYFFKGYEQIVSSGLALFQRILYDIALHDSLICLKDYHEVSLTKMTEGIKLARKGLETKLSKIDRDDLKTAYKSQAIDDPRLWFWFETVIGISKQKAETNSQIRQKLAVYNLTIDQVGHRRLTAHRKIDSDTWKKLRSFAWKKGIRKKSLKGGVYEN